MRDTAGDIIDQQDDEIAKLKDENERLIDVAITEQNEAIRLEAQVQELRVRLGIAESFIPVEKLSVYEARLAGREWLVKNYPVPDVKVGPLRLTAGWKNGDFRSISIYFDSPKHGPNVPIAFGTIPESVVEEIRVATGGEE